MKKDQNVTVCITNDLKQNIEEMAKDRRWTISSTICYILEEYFKRATEAREAVYKGK